MYMMKHPFLTQSLLLAIYELVVHPEVPQVRPSVPYAFCLLMFAHVFIHDIIR